MQKDSVQVELENMSKVDCVHQIDGKETFSEETKNSSSAHNQEVADKDVSKDTALKQDNCLQTNVEEIESKVGRSQKLTSTTTSGGHGEDDKNKHIRPENMSTTDSIHPADRKETLNKEIQFSSVTHNEEVSNKDSYKDTTLRHDDNILQRKVEELEKKVKSKIEKAEGYKLQKNKEKEEKQRWQRLVYLWRTKADEWLQKIDKCSDTQGDEDFIVTGKEVTSNVQEISTEPLLLNLDQYIQTCLDESIKTQKEIQSWEKKNKDLLDSVSKLEENLKIMQNEKERLMQEIKSHEAKKEELEKIISTLEESLETSIQERDNLRKEMNSQRQKITDMSRKVNETKDSLKTTQSEMDIQSGNLEKYERENEQLSKSTGRLKNKSSFLRQENQRLEVENQKLKEETEELCLSVKMKDDQITTMSHENNHLKEVDDKLRLRLSEIAGSLLVNRNPTIADLSDATRPTKLAEIFSELYDNQWTDAFEEEEGPDHNIIERLLRLLMKIHSSCQKVSSAYLSELENIISILPGTDTSIFEQTVDIPVTTRKFLIEIRRSVSEQIIRALITHFRNTFIHNKKKSGKEMKAIAIYIDKCTELCWFMAIKDPPVILGDIPKEGEPVNKELYKCYTRSGQYVDYCVWPPLLLHKGGPVLCKGIVQGK